jgi:hypothetical protein
MAYIIMLTVLFSVLTYFTITKTVYIKQKNLFKYVSEYLLTTIYYGFHKE